MRELERRLDSREEALHRVRNEAREQIRALAARDALRVFVTHSRVAWARAVSAADARRSLSIGRTFVGDGATATARLHLLLLGRLACTARKRFPDSHGAMWGDDGHVLILWHRSIRGVYCGIVVATGQRDARGGAVFSLD